MKKCMLIMLAVAMYFAACQEVEVPLTEENLLSAVIEQNETTKTVMDDNNNILWSANDQIIAFMKSSYGHKYQVKSSFVGKSYADFSRISSGSGDDLSAGNEWDHNIAYYPYSEAIECLKSGSNYVLDVFLPSEQTYAAESFGNSAMAMVAVSEDNNITFRNVLGGMKLKLKGTQKVKSITLQGKNNEKLSGAATVTAYTDETKPAITMPDDASTSVTLNCGAVQLNESTATEFIIALPPVLFSKGFTVTVTDSDSQTYTVETDKANTVLRSSLLVMPSVKLGNDPSEESEIPEIPADPQPESTSFIRRSLLTQFYGTGCVNCPGMKHLLTEVFKDQVMQNKVVRTAVHSYNEDDPAYIGKYVTSVYYPMINMDFVESTGYSSNTLSSDIRNWMDGVYSAQDAMAGIAVNSAYKDGKIVINAAVKAAVKGQYRIGALLVEDGIEGQQSGAKPSETDMHIHNHCVRFADCATNNSGHKLGTIKAGDTVEYFFSWDLNDASMQWNKKPYGGSLWKAPVMENTYLVLCVYVTDSTGISIIVNNAITAAIGTSVQFEYSK